MEVIFVYLCISQDKLNCVVVTNDSQSEEAYKNKVVFLTHATCLFQVAVFLSLIPYSRTETDKAASVSGVENYGSSWAKSSLPSLFINKVLLRHTHGHSFFCITYKLLLHYSRIE